MSFVKVASLSQLPADSLTEITIGDDIYALCNVGGRLSAIGGTCLHRGGPLGQGALHGNHVVCPWHAWEWDCQTGAYDFDPTKKVPAYPVQVDGDDILIDVAKRA
jgi:nitrite reductase (NADH) small subunit